MEAATRRPYGKGKILEIERGNTRSHYVANSLWESLWTCSKTLCDDNDCINYRGYVILSKISGCL
jgi:hypothetical protein